jgi:hypothetical protein
LADRIQCEFFLIRYVPDVVKGEFTNIGVLLREAGAASTESTVVRFTRDWSRVRCMDADADIALLEALEGEIGERLRLGAADTKPVMQVLEDTLSNSVQITEARAALAESVPAELEQLMRKRIAASLYTRPGDPMKIDCGYRADQAEAGLIRMFQAVSLEGDVEAAKGLAYTAPQLREGVERVENARLELTAVIEPLRAVSGAEDEATERYRFGVEAMEREAIRVVTLSDLARVAEAARMELRV